MFRAFLAFALVFPAIAAAQTPAQNNGKYLVTFRAGTPPNQRAATVQRAGGKLRFNYSILDAVAISEANPGILSQLRNDPSVQEIVPDLPVFAFQDTVNVRPNAKPGSGGGGGGTPAQVTPLGVS